LMKFCRLLDGVHTWLKSGILTRASYLVHPSFLMDEGILGLRTCTQAKEIVALSAGGKNMK